MPHAVSNPILQIIRRVFDDPRMRACADDELLERFVRDKNEAAFEALLRRHGPMVLGVCRTMLPNGADAEDAFQATFLILASKAKSIRKANSLASWLHGVAYRIARKAQTAFARRQKHESLVSNRDDPSKADDLSWREVRELIHEEVNNLPDGCRSAVVLCYLEDMTQDEAAKELGLSKGTLKGRLERGRELLRARLIRRGLGAGAIGIASVWPAVGLSADVSAVLVTSTARASIGLAGGQAIAGLVSPRVAALATGMLRAMFLSKVKTATAILALVGLFCIGASSLSIYLWAGPHEAEERQELVKELPPPGPVAPPDRARLDAVGDPLPPEAVARFGTLRFRHAGWVTNVAFLPDGKSLASVGWDGTIRIWDAKSGAARHRFQGTRLAVAPDGQTLACWDWGQPVVLRDIATGKQIRQFQAQQRHPKCVAFSPDGRFLATGGGVYDDDAPLLLWNVATGTNLPVPKYIGGRKGESAARLAFSPDSKLLATAGEHGATVQLWEVGAAKEVTPRRNLPEGNRHNPPTAFAFSPDGRLIASAGEHGPLIRVWDVATGKEKLQMLFPNTGVNSVAYSPDGSLLAAGNLNGLIRVWDATTGKELRSWQAIRGYVYSHQGGVLSTTFSADSKTLVSGGTDHTIRFWDPKTGESLHSQAGHHGSVAAVAFAHDGNAVVSSGDDYSIRLWDLTAAKEVRQFVGHQSPVYAVALSPDGKTLVSRSDSYGQDNTLRFWEFASGKEVRRFGEFGRRRTLTFSPDGQTLGVAAKDGISLLNVASARERFRLVKNGSSGTFVAFSPNGKTVAWGSFDNDDRFCLHFSDATVGKILGTVEIDTSSQANWGDFSPDGETLLILMDGRISNWTKSGKQESLKFAASAKRDINCAALSGDRKTLAAGCKDGAISLWEVATGQERARFPGHQGAARYENQGGVASVAWSTDGKKLVTGGEDTTILVWEVAALMGQDRKPPAKLTPQDLEQLWAELASDDAGKAYRAIGHLAASPQAAARFLGKHLQPPSLDPKQIARLIAELNDDRFQVRDKATQQLARLGPSAAGALKQALAGPHSVEVRRRIEALLEPLQSAELTTERLRAWRAIEALEYIGSTDAQEILETLSPGNDAARTALDRLRRRKIVP